jgi:uncharacterized protein YbjT (DUF2867 family)
MHSNPKILITGATGNVGSEVVKSLQKKNLPIAIGIRKKKKIKETHKEIDYRELDFQKPETYNGALEGVKSIFLVRPPAISNVKKEIRPFLETAKEKGVEHIVFLSVIGADKNSFIPHFKIEKVILELGFAYTFLRAGFFMQNFSKTHRQEIKEKNEIIIPGGATPLSFIDVVDLGKVGAECLTSQKHHNQIYPLTGPELLSFNDVAEIFSRELGTKITYINPSIVSFYLYRRYLGDKFMQILVMIMLYSITRFSPPQEVTPYVQDITSERPGSFESYVKENRDLWKN